MSRPLIQRIARIWLVACLLPSLAAAQSDVAELLGVDCLVAVQVVETACGDCCSSEEPAETCPPGCEHCPCCPGLAPAISAVAPLQATSVPADVPVLEAASELTTRDADRIFRPPRAGVRS